MQFVWERVWTDSISRVGEGAMAPMDLLEPNDRFETALLLKAAGCSMIPSMLVAGPVW